MSPFAGMPVNCNNMTMNRIPQINPWLAAEEVDAVTRVLSSGWITEGRECEAFGAALNEVIGVPYGVFAPNGTLALALALMAVGVEPGDEVLIPDTTFIGSATATVMIGAVPVFVDVDPVSYQIDMEDARRCLTSRSRAVMPVHLYGTACDMDAVLAFAHNHELKVVEDAAQGMGVRYKGRHVGSIGHAGCFSFFADKTITTGEGGYVACQDREIYERLRRLRNQGRPERGSFVHHDVGFNFRITDMQAAIGRVQLERLPKIAARKNELWESYRAALADLSAVRLLGPASEANQVPFRAVLICDRSQELMAFLDSNGVQSRGFFYPLHRQPCFADGKTAKGGSDERFPNAVHGFEHGLCLPIYPGLNDHDVDRIAGLIDAFYNAEPRQQPA